MIGTVQALADIGTIASTPRFDGLYVGPADLTLALAGRRHRTELDREEPETMEAIHRVLRAA